MLPPEATMSVEADLIPLDGTEALADRIDGAIGEASMFHETFGVYAQGVGYETITAPNAWHNRLIAYSNDNTDGVTPRMCNSNNCPAGIATQKPELRARLDIDTSAERLATFFQASVELMSVMARACGHDHLSEFTQHDLATWDHKMAQLTGIRFSGLSS